MTRFPDWGQVVAFEIEVMLQGPLDAALVLDGLASRSALAVAQVIVQRPDLPREVLECLVRHKDRGVREHVAGSCFLLLTEDLVDVLAQDTYALVRARVARQVVDPMVQSQFVGDSSFWVRSSLARNPTLAGDAMTRLSFDVPTVQAALAANGTVVPSRDFSVRFMCLPEVPRSTLEDLLPGVDREALWALASNWDGDVMSLGEAVGLVSR